MAWFKVDDKLHSSRKLLRIPRRHRLAALGLWTMAGSWCADQLTDGIVPDYMIEEWGGSKVLVEWLVKAELWLELPEGTEFKNWAEYQPTKAEKEAEREKNREKLAKWRERNQRGNQGVTGLHDGSNPIGNPAPDPTRPDPTRPIEEANASSASEPERPDVEHVITSFSGLLKANDVKHNKPGKAWKDAARLLIDKDGYTVDQILYVARYATADEFWKSNILSLPKLREKFEALKIKAQTQNRPQPQRMDHSARARAKEAEMLARFEASQEQQALQIEG